jgi:hypothetical protein
VLDIGHRFSQPRHLFGSEVPVIRLAESGEFDSTGGVAADQAVVDCLLEDGGEALVSLTDARGREGFVRNGSHPGSDHRAVDGCQAGTTGRT